MACVILHVSPESARVRLGPFLGPSVVNSVIRLCQRGFMWMSTSVPVCFERDAHPQTLYITMNQLRMHLQKDLKEVEQERLSVHRASNSPKPIHSHLKTPSSGYLINYSIGFTFLFWKLLLGTLLCTVFLLQTICFLVLRFSYLNWDRIAHVLCFKMLNLYYFVNVFTFFLHHQQVCDSKKNILRSTEYCECTVGV